MATVQSEGATIFAILYYYISGKINAGGKEYSNLSKLKTVEAITYARNYLLSNFGKTAVQLGDYQKLVKGEKAIG